MLLFSAEGGRVSCEISGIGGCHACHFGFFCGRIEGQIHLLSSFELAPSASLSLGNLLCHLWLFLGMLARQFLLVFLELQLEAQVRAHVRPDLSDVFECVAENRIIFFHVVGDDEGGGLHVLQLTREMPAPQCTSTEPLLRSASISEYFIRWSGRRGRSRPRCSRS